MKLLLPLLWWSTELRSGYGGGWLQLLSGVFNSESQHDPKNVKPTPCNLPGSPELLCGQEVVPRAP